MVVLLQRLSVVTHRNFRYPATPVAGALPYTAAPEFSGESAMKYEYPWNDWAGRLLRQGLVVVPLACVAAGMAVLVAG